MTEERLLNKVALVVNNLIPRSRVEPVIDQISAWLAGYGITALWVETGSGEWLGLSEARLAGVDLAIALGGDGTVLASSRKFADQGVPVLGVRLGKLGFLSEVEPAGVANALQALVEGRFRLEHRLMLEARVIRNGEIVYRDGCLNDVVMSRGAILRAIEIAFEIDGEPIARFAGDGLIVATPTGSTAYSLSAGGPLLAPDLPLILVTPLCPHSLCLRPYVVGPDCEICIYLTRPARHSLVVLDGQETWTLQEGDELHVRRAPFDCRLVRLGDESCFRVLKQKLYGGNL